MNKNSPTTTLPDNKSHSEKNEEKNPKLYRIMTCVCFACRRRHICTFICTISKMWHSLHVVVHVLLQKNPFIKTFRGGGRARYKKCCPTYFIFLFSTRFGHVWTFLNFNCYSTFFWASCLSCIFFFTHKSFHILPVVMWYQHFKVTTKICQCWQNT